MNDFSAATGRQYQPFELRASASGTGDYPDALCHWHLKKWLNELLIRGEKVGVLKVRLYRPFSAKHLLQLCRDPYAAWRYWTDQRTRCPGRTALSGCDDRTGRSL
ncbi:hypothetical protein ACVXG9_04955 [Escherichia coli]